METKFSVDEAHTVEQMREELAKTFGVTCVNGYVTLRFGNRKSVTMRIEEIGTGFMTPCFGCGEMYHNKELHDSTVSIETCGGGVVNTEKLCYDCYCPK